MLFTALLVIAPLPSLLSSVDRSYALRSALVFPVLFILIALGLVEFTKYVKNKIVWLGVGVVYILLIVNFFNIYLFENPVYNTEGFAFSERVLSKYVDLASNDRQVVVLADGAGALLKQYLFYTNGYNSVTEGEIRKIYRDEIFSFNNIQYMSCDANVAILKDSVIVSFARAECGNIPEDQPHLSISQLSDGGEVYKIYDDTVCGKYNLNRYPRNISFNDLKVEDLDEFNFCQQYVMRL